MVVGICIATALYSISLYLPTVINSMGHDLLQSQLMTAPPYFVGWFVALATALHSDKVKERSFHFIFGGCLALIGFLGLATIENKSLLYASTFFCTAGVTTIVPIQLAWVSSIFSKPHDKRAIAQSMYIAFSNIAGYLNAKTITNCFHHTGLFDYEITTSTHEVHPNDKDLSVLAELEESLKMLSPCHPMSLAHYTNLPEEIDLVHQEFTDTDLLALTIPETDDDADSINNNNSSFTILSNSVKFDAIRTVISLLDTTIFDHNAVLRTLHLLQ
ncbi:4146_t:CDS:2 [Scutellospora calospora]|uniref:4146_t:CDS:1 n=1 Tax=Scutellospora calospora TaxID=85575 RepID=A0ACA9L8F0_9GLOM|nr:4146_t:CDS:2 [Scutellospora calospora]